MIARISPSPNALAAACFPVPGCTVGGYATKTGYKLFISPPQPWAGPTVYCGHGATCYDALAAAVQLFHDTAHAYPDATPLAAAGSYCPPQVPQSWPSDDEPAHDWPTTIRTEQDNARTMLRLRSITGRPSADEQDEEAAFEAAHIGSAPVGNEWNANPDEPMCRRCSGSGISNRNAAADCQSCKGTGKR